MKKRWKWAIGIVAFCILAPIVETIVTVETRFHARDEGAAAASSFLDALAVHSYEQAHTMLTAPQQQALSASAMQKLENEAEKKYGTPTRKAAVDEYHVNDNFRQVRFLYDNAYQNQRNLVSVTMVRTDSGWQVSKYQYDYNPA